MSAKSDTLELLEVQQYLLFSSSYTDAEDLTAVSKETVG